MENEHFLFLIFCIAYYALHSLMASNWMKATIKLSTQAYRILFNIVALLSLLPGIPLFLNITTNAPIHTSALFTYVGIAMSILGTLIIVIAFKNYDLMEFTGLGKSKPNEKLRIDGLNKHIRHPLYTGAFLLVWGMYLGKMETNFLIIAIVTTIYIYIGTKLEEQKLIEMFGEDYVRYKREVGMFFPKLI